MQFMTMREKKILAKAIELGVATILLGIIW